MAVSSEKTCLLGSQSPYGNSRANIYVATGEPTEHPSGINQQPKANITSKPKSEDILNFHIEEESTCAKRVSHCTKKLPDAKTCCCAFALCLGKTACFCILCFFEVIVNA